MIPELGNTLLKTAGLHLVMKGNTFALCILAEGHRIVVASV